MRLHSLEITAFGPFAKTVSVDFDTLSAAGLFLLTGATGAGKSSVLDAVCFALYGDVPGDRASAKRLRCDLAPDDLEPRVVLEATIGDRRFRFRRSPAWQRPKRRGEGTTTQQASVLVEEVLSDGDRLLTSRLDEAGHLVSELLGMNLTQFTQVALLPQGRFQEFLRARSDARQALLQKLFRTRRFEAIERWLREHRLSLKHALDAATDDLLECVHRIDEASGLGLDPELADGQIDDAALQAWVASAQADSERFASETSESLERAVAASDEAHVVLAAATELAGLQARHRSAVQARALLAEEAPEIEPLRERVALARRAAPIAALHEVALRARRRRAEADCLLAEATDSTDDRAAHEAAVAHLQERLASVPTLREAEREHAALAEEQAVAAGAIARLEAEEQQLLLESEALPQHLVALREQHHAAREALARLPILAEVLASTRVRREAATTLLRVRSELEQAQRDLRVAIDQHQSARETWLHLHETRIHGMAAEIALDLAVGASCPVCGSCEHPEPASAAPGAPTASAEKEARRAVDDVEILRHAQSEVVSALETRVAVLAEVAGPDPDVTALAAAESDAEAAHAAALRCADTAEPLAGDLATAEARQTDLATAIAGLRIDLASRGIERQARAARIGTLVAQLGAALAGHPDADALAEDLERDLAGHQAILAAYDAVTTALQAEAEAEADLHRVATELGFDSPAQAVDSLLPGVELDHADRRIVDHDRRLAAANASLADVALAAAAAEPAPDLAALADAQAVAGQAARDAQAAHQVASTRHARLLQLREDFEAALATWRPARSAYALALQVATFAEGRSPDNREQMRLSAYVLTWRLGQVVAAANERLATMTDQRYTLEHTTRRGAGETRGGLSLLVRDEWSGERRDPATLSGGETFVVSLALALGLTDVVAHEAGGAEIGTLFVDEGFGTLDPDTLDDVMDTLDRLRDGGRAVGIVSHVPELRTRIPAQLRIGKGRAGSSIELVHEVG